MSRRKPKAEAEPEAAPKPPPEPRREPTDAERRAMEAATVAQAQRPARASLKVAAVKGQSIAVAHVHNDTKGAVDLIHEALGTAADGFADNTLADLIAAVQPRASEITSDHYAAGLALMGAIPPGLVLHLVNAEASPGLP